jgi:hypothetical protein
MAAMYRTQGTATDRKKFTVSMWVKIAKTGSEKTSYQFMDFYGGGSDRISLYHNNNDYLQIYHEKANSGVNEVAWISDAIIRDKTAWYHFVWRADSTQSTAADRFRVYINGELITLNSTTYPSQNFEFAQGTSSYVQYIGRYGGNTDNNFEGVMSHVNFCDGYSYGPDSFGSTDATTGIWKINTSPSVTYGNNGFFLKMEDASNLDLDSSPNAHSFTTGGGTVTPTLDCPSNNFATMNSLENHYQNSTFSNADTTVVTTSGNYSYNTATMGVNSGKYYWEVKTGSSNAVYMLIGIASQLTTGSTNFLGNGASDYGYYGNGGQYYNNGSQVSYGNGYTANDIVGVALDLDNNKLYFSKNGTWQNSGDPTSGSTGTGAISITDPSSTTLGHYFPAVSEYDNSNSYTFYVNFGNGYFGTTAISSEGTNASNIGKFEYDVPTGYTALCTKGLNE